MKLQTLGWNERFESLFGSFRSSRLVPARVTRVDRGVLIVNGEMGSAPVSIASRVHPDGESGPPAVGDWVGMDLIDGVGVVRVILPRTSALIRRRPGEKDREQVAAANVDLVFVVEPLDRGPNPRRIERATAIAWDGGAEPVVVLTKLDLCDDPAKAIARAGEGAPFVDVLAVSANSGRGMERLAQRVAEGPTAVLLGPSGSGKSTLTNRLLGEERLAVSQVRPGDRRGRHTTTFRELFVLPHGGCLIDTPGVRELGLWLDPEAVKTAFSEIEEAAEGCYFSDCRHEGEPGCAVREEVEEGSLDEKRLASYLRLIREAENLEMRRDRSKHHEVRALERSFSKMVRQVTKRKNNR
jgi:ribosome biogenesis GTPase